MEDRGIISRRTIENSISSITAYRIREDGRGVGGLVQRISRETQHNHFDLLFVVPETRSKGIGYSVRQEIERLYAETNV